MPSQIENVQCARQSTGTPGLDEILCGGLMPKRIYLVQGGPGTGKTTLALQWLLAGVRAGEPVVFLAMAETKDELQEVAQSHGWSLDGITICESVVSSEALHPEAQYSVFHPTDVELNEITARLVKAVERVKPTRVVIDSLSEMRLLAQSPFRHRQQVVALKRFLKQHGCTALMVDDTGDEPLELHLHTAMHGVIHLDQAPLEYGPDRRRLRCVKMRGKAFTTGYHDIVLSHRGLKVFPRLGSAEVPGGFEPGQLKSSIPEIDALMGGGPRYGSSVLVMGSAGTGKSSLTQQFAVAAARRGERAAIFNFEESLETLLVRSDALQLGVREQMEAGRLRIEPVDAGQVSPGEFADHVRRTLEHPREPATRVVVIDSLNAYANAMPQERFLLRQFSELVAYLGRRGIVTFLVLGHRGMIGDPVPPVETTFLADDAVLMRFFEVMGEVRLAISVVKMRACAHERTIRELCLTAGGIQVGEPLRQFQGVLTGVPQFMGEDGLLTKAND